MTRARKENGGAGLTAIHICGVPDFKPGDPAPEGYSAWHEWARIQHKAGLRQRRCACCSLWNYPQEMSARVLASCPIDGKTFKPVRMVDPVCLKCASNGRGIAPEDVEAVLAEREKAALASIERLTKKVEVRRARATKRKR